tara:strand:+ start:1243 stop:1902 length:660 start_codon:yes stop_codon:yes gene_type:complete
MTLDSLTRLLEDKKQQLRRIENISNLASTNFFRFTPAVIIALKLAAALIRTGLVFSVMSFIDKEALNQPAMIKAQKDHYGNVGLVFFISYILLCASIFSLLGMAKYVTHLKYHPLLSEKVNELQNNIFTIFDKQFNFNDDFLKSLQNTNDQYEVNPFYLLNNLKDKKNELEANHRSEDLKDILVKYGTFGVSTSEAKIEFIVESSGVSNVSQRHNTSPH